MKLFFVYQQILNKLYIATCFIISYFLPIKEWLAAIFFAVITEIITKLTADLKSKNKLNLEDWLIKGLKIFSYFLSIMLAFIIEKKLLVDMPVVKFIGALILSAELKLIDNNFQVITGISVFSSIIKTFKKKEGN